MNFITKLTLRAKRAFKNPIIEHVSPTRKGSMIGAGVRKLEKEFVTHTTLHHHKSAVNTFVLWQKLFLIFATATLTFGLVVNALLTLQIFVGILTVIYFADVLFNLFLVLKSLHLPPELDFGERELSKIKDKTLPVYTILCPMYKEAKILPSFLRAISSLDWPKSKLDVQLLLEEDDLETIHAANNWGLPSYVRVVVVPHSQPKTKPKACNYGLNKAKGEYLVIYDAEDIPDTKQLKKAYLAFQKVDQNVVCLQAKLNYFNPHQNFITRLFTAEYSLWFDVVLPGLQGINTNIPLGGTSNHFRVADLKQLEGWDPFNVTEDCDLGVRLFIEGKRTAVINSTTLEEANSKFKNWLRQRSRWIKGYMQTYLVHMRNPYQLARKQGIHALFFNLVVGGKIAFMFINPFLWMMTIAYFAFRSQIGASIEALFPSYVFYMAVFSLVVGNFLFMFYYMIGCAKREHWSLVKYVYLVPFYWIMTSIAATIALQQLFFKPHYWEKTVHGLHLPLGENQVVSQSISDVGVRKPFAFPKISKKMLGVSVSRSHVFGGFLVISTALASVINFVFAAYMGRVLSFEDFALVGLLGGLISLIGIVFGSLGTTVTHRTGFLIGKYGENVAANFWAETRKKSLYVSIFLAITWIVISPFLRSYFKLTDLTPLLLFTPIILVSLVFAVDKGLLYSRFDLSKISILTIIQPLFKLLLAAAIVFVGFNDWTYVSIPMSAVIAFLIGWVFIQKTELSAKLPQANLNKFPNKFFLISLFSGISSIIFLNLDVVLANHYLDPTNAGIYTLSSLIGKMIYFLASFASPFTIPFVSRNEGANKNSKKFLYLTTLATVSLSLPAFLMIVFFSDSLVPLMFGAKAIVSIPYLPIISFAMVCFSISRVFSEYYLAKKYYSFSALALVLGVIQLILLEFVHDSVWTFVYIMSFIWIFNLVLTLALHLLSNRVKSIENNIGDLTALFARIGNSKVKDQKSLRVLIFNWRDTKHVWGGGSETYIHELAKRWVENGNSVTVFCGNDGRSTKNDVIDGVRIVRRGGFYTVYFWAFVYYALKFRGKFDVVVDSENGLPFFTPLYTRKPKFLLIHHIHQEVFRTQLKFPFSKIAMLLESKLMPLVYKNQHLITVSESSKKEILKMKLSKFKTVEIINPGINATEYKKQKKTSYMSVLYLGRLKPYKNIDVAIKAFAEVLKSQKNAVFYIAGVGESLNSLRKLVDELNISGSVKFLGRVSEEEKSDLLSSCWIMVQPSMIEGWGITVIEANASGTPVVASDVNGLRDSIVDGVTGILVKPGDSNEMAEKILLITNKKRTLNKFSNEAYSWSKKFSWELSANRFFDQLEGTVFKKSIGADIEISLAEIN